MRTEDLIEKISEDLNPVESIRSPIRMAFLVIFLGLLAALLSLVFLHIRPDLYESLHRGPFLFSTIGLLASAVLMSLASAFSGFPGRAAQRPSLLIAGFTLVYLVVSLLFWGATEPLGEGLGKVTHAGRSCSASALVMGIVPFFVLGFWLKKLAPPHPALSGALVGLASASLGGAVLSFNCPNDHPDHLLNWHIALPMGVFLVLGAASGRKWLRW